MQPPGNLEAQIFFKNDIEDRFTGEEHQIGGSFMNMADIDRLL
jgi:hypothetical protein